MSDKKPVRLIPEELTETDSSYYEAGMLAILGMAIVFFILELV